MGFDPETWDGEHALPKLYSRTASGAINTWEIWLDKAGGVVVRWGQVGGVTQTAVFQCERKNVGRANATTALEQSRSEAISKWKKQIKKKYFINLDEAKQGPKLRPMLAKEFFKKNKAGERVGKRNVTFPVDVQRKYDGVRNTSYWDGPQVRLHSRIGDIYDVEHIRAEVQRLVPPGTMLDGELYVHGLSCQKISSLVKRPQEESLRLTYCVYDMVDLQHPEPWEVRKDNLLRWFEWARTEEGLKNFIVQVLTFAAYDESDIKVLHDEFVAEGYEGAIIRTLDAPYRIGYRSAELLKYKEFDDGEFKLTGFKRGKGKFIDVPIFQCTMSNGATFDVTPRGTEEVRSELLATAKSLLGKMYTVRYFGLTDEGIPRFPVGIGVREKGM